MSGEVVERGPGRGDQVGEKRGFWIPARIGDRTKRSRAGSGSGGAAGGSWGGLVTCMCRSEGHREDVPAGVAGGPGVASPGGAEAGDPLCHSWNPCSVGRVVATSRIGVANHSIYVLESLFCWKSRCNKEIGMSRPGNERWNPCSVGRVVATAGYFDQYHHLSVGILVLLEGSLQPYPVRAGITLAPPHHFRFSGASPRTSSAHPNSLPASVMKISFGTSPGAGRGLAGPPSPVSGINPCSFQSGYFSIAHSPKQLADRSSTAGPPPTARGCGTALQGSGR